ncbi:MAG: Asp23/Gls24 family envelope stress response protein [Synergistaceae bacterium]|nr:Asp23/Gls24 family envelope stress response protein [Synergistaceae bacterium]
MDQNVEGKNAATDAVQAKGQFEGSFHISNDVIIELAKKVILGIPNIQTANMGIASKFAIGRKSGDGIRVSVEDGKIPAITVDAYILVKYGQRIPDLAWDVQEKLKANLERYTGYIVTAVNINVQGIYLDEPQTVSELSSEKDDADNVPVAGVETEE